VTIEQRVLTAGALLTALVFSYAANALPGLFPWSKAALFAASFAFFGAAMWFAGGGDQTTLGRIGRLLAILATAIMVMLIVGHIIIPDIQQTLK
jgi:hypothetical protein